MDSKFYVSLEAARLLKEKGYNEKTEKAYATINDGTTIKVLQVVHNNKELPELCYSCPTKAEAIDWLDSKEVYIQIVGVGSGATQKWSYSVFDYKTCDNYASDYIFLTRLEAEEAAIIKALELL
jgi:hypothetical protein